MALTAGTRLGSYEIVAPIGTGGMGEVYRARDTKLDRDVAIKVLPPHLASDPEALARFEREAKAVAALSHPNILAIHDFGRDASVGVSYAVMELLDGATLRARLDDGPVALKKAIQIGADVASGLAAAHARGIVHRDLKPENLFVTSDGRVKILDFGLARSAAADASYADSPTAMRRTDPGTVLGTVGYMSPEQVRGLPADQRSDIFSLGCVLYEIITGTRAFQRDTGAETMTAILREDPQDLSASGITAPGGVDAVIRHCLEKQPDERFQSARDLAFALHSLSSPSSTSGRAAALDAAPAALRVNRSVLLAAGAGAVVLAAAAFFAGRGFGGDVSADASVATTFQQLTDAAGIETDPAISPDGASVAYARNGDVFVQRVGGRNPIPVAQDPSREEGGPAFSPDGTVIAFHDGQGKGGIFVAGATGESAKRVTDFGFHPAWSHDGTRIVFCTEKIETAESRATTSALWVVETAGGAPRKITDGDAVMPSWSPSGKHIVYWAEVRARR
jgi:hypothetical protein